MPFLRWLPSLSIPDLHQAVKNKGLWNPAWWASSFAAAALFVPWLPILYSQFTRNKGLSWTPTVSASTLPDTLLHFLLYNTVEWIGVISKLGIGLVFLVVCGLAIRYAGNTLSLLLLKMLSSIAATGWSGRFLISFVSILW